MEDNVLYSALLCMIDFEPSNLDPILWKSFREAIISFLINFRLISCRIDKAKKKLARNSLKPELFISYSVMIHFIINNIAKTMIILHNTDLTCAQQNFATSYMHRIEAKVPYVMNAFRYWIILETTGSDKI